MLGILYHLKNPNDFMNQVYNKMLSKSTLILETIISHTDQSLFFNKNERYAGMKNVHHILNDVSIYLKIQNFLDNEYSLMSYLNLQPQTYFLSLDLNDHLYFQQTPKLNKLFCVNFYYPTQISLNLLLMVKLG